MKKDLTLFIKFLLFMAVLTCIIMIPQLVSNLSSDNKFKEHLTPQKDTHNNAVALNKKLAGQLKHVTSMIRQLQ